MNNFWVQKQIKKCQEHNVMPFPTQDHLRLGITPNVRDKIYPINGLRIMPENNTSGWYIWAGEKLSEDPDFFVPLHINHLENWCDEIIQFLLLPPCWRFLIAPNYEDVWFDEEVLKRSV